MPAASAINCDYSQKDIIFQKQYLPQQDAENTIASVFRSWLDAAHMDDYNVKHELRSRSVIPGDWVVAKELGYA